MAEPEVYVSIFVDKGAPWLPCSRGSAKRERPSPRRGARRFPGVRGQAADGAWAQRYILDQEVRDRGAPGLLVEPTSEREIGVLRFLASGTPNREIAATLFVPLDTVKSHLRHFYNKFGVHSRTQVLAGAKELDLIE
jgi:DNA-binding NarL/FixJ family response regulator